MIPGTPTRDEVKAFVGPSVNEVSDEQLDRIIDAEATIQARICRVDDVETLPDPLYQAVLRRVAVHIARKGLLQGVVGGDYEHGPLPLSRWDAETSRLEASYLIPVVA